MPNTSGTAGIKAEPSCSRHAMSPTPFTARFAEVPSTVCAKVRSQRLSMYAVAGQCLLKVDVLRTNSERRPDLPFRMLVLDHEKFRDASITRH